MYRFTIRTLVFLFCWFALHAVGEENRIVRVGVVMMQSQASQSMPGDAGRNRLVAALDQEKPDKKHHLRLQGVPLAGTTPEEISAEAKQQNCDYVVYTSLVDLQQASSGNVMQQPQSQPGGVQPYPGGLGMPPNTGNPNAGGMGQGAGGMNRGYRATVEYRLYRAGDASPVASSSVTGQQSGPDEAVVSQVLNQVANRVMAEVKKAPPAGQQ